MQPVAYNQEIAAFLDSCNIATSDLQYGSRVHFFCLTHNDELAGVAGVEIHGDAGLLRSLAVAECHRGSGIAKALTASAEAWAINCGLTRLYLLTNTAAAYFARLGYEVLPRTEAPSGIRQTKQFSSLCPGSAIFMGKRLEAKSTRTLAAPPLEQLGPRG